MAENFLTVVSTKLHTWTRTIGANNVDDEFVLPGEFPYPTYSATPNAAFIACTTANDHLMQVMAGSSLNLKVRRIRVEQGALITTAAICSFAIYRLTTAGTGGTAITPGKFDTSDAASGATAMSLPSAKGTESTLIDILSFFPTQTASVSGSAPQYREWVARPDMKSLTVPAGTTNGIAIKNLYARPGLTVTVTVDFVEQSF